MDALTRLGKYIKPYTKLILAALFCSVFVAFFSFLPAYILKEIIDKVLDKRDSFMLKLLAAGSIFMILGKGIFFYFENYLMNYISQKTLFNVRSHLFQHIQILSLTFYEKNKIGQIMSRVTNDVMILQNILLSVITFITSFIQIIFLLVWILYLHWKLTLCTLVLFPVIGLIVSKLSKKIRAIGAQMQMKVGDITAIIQENLTGIRVVKSFTMEQEEIKKFNNANQENFDVNLKNIKITSLLLPVVELINTTGLAFVLWYGGTEVIKGKLTSGQLISFLASLGMLFTPFQRLTRVNSTIQQSIAAAQRIFEILDTEPEIIEDIERQREDMPAIKGSVKFKKVNFAYQGTEKYILKNINIEVNPSQVIALVGPSGAGKSTFVNLIPRFYNLNEGEIFIDNINISNVTLKSIRQQIGIVPQETILFNTTIFDNILYGRDGANEEEVYSAAKQANAHDFILKLDNGYETIVGDRGVRLSGGQRQRIAIARAILRNPRILILDEATSSLDSESEKLVQEALDSLMKDRTTFVIAHRLSTIINADKIIVIEKGQIVETGTHEELLKNKGLYSELYKVQFEK